MSLYTNNGVIYCVRCHQFIACHLFIYHHSFCHVVQPALHHNQLNNYNKISSYMNYGSKVKKSSTKFKLRDIVQFENNGGPNQIAEIMQIFRTHLEITYPVSSPIIQRRRLLVHPSQLTLLYVPPNNCNKEINKEINKQSNEESKTQSSKQVNKSNKESNKSNKQQQQHCQPKKAKKKKKKTYKQLLKCKLSTSEKNILYLTEQARIDASFDIKLAKCDTKAIIDRFYKVLALHISKTLACIYLIDSIVQSIGAPYIQLFDPYIYKLMKSAYLNKDISQMHKKKIKKVLFAWIKNKIFSASLLHRITDSNKRLLQQASSTVIIRSRPHKRRKISDSKREEDAYDIDDNDDELQIISATKSIRCPLTLCIMRNPVKSTICGHIFDKYAIFNYINSTCTDREESEHTDVPCPIPGCVSLITTNCLKMDLETKLLIQNNKKNSQMENTRKKPIEILELLSDEEDNVDNNSSKTNSEDSDSDSDIQIL